VNADAGYRGMLLTSINLGGDLGISHMAIAKNPKIQAEIEHLFEGPVRPGRSLPSHTLFAVVWQQLKIAIFLLYNPVSAKKAPSYGANLLRFHGPKIVFSAEKAHPDPTIPLRLHSKKFGFFQLFTLPREPETKVL